MYKDSRLEKIAQTIVNYSVNVKKDENVFIKACIDSKILIKEIIKKVYEAGGRPFVRFTDEEIERCIYESATKEVFETAFSWDEKIYKEMDCYIMIRTRENEGELSKIKQDTIMQNIIAGSEITKYVVENKKWVLLEWPTKAMAQKANMSLDECADFMFNACCSDYEKIKEQGDVLKSYLKTVNKVRIVSDGTDIELSVKDCEIAVTAGNYNLPDGEVATAPVIDSINGKIKFNTPSINSGTVFESVELTFKDGKIINAKANNDTEKLNKIFDSDEGARFVGEFAFGLNPSVTIPFGSPLYDEKIVGSIHIAPGKSLPGICDNGNKSMIHWDLVLIQTKEYGGGEIYFDGKLARKDGIFVIPQLQILNN